MTAGHEWCDRPLALLSVTDKTGIVNLARGLAELGFGLLSTGGTARALREAGIAVHEVSEYTGSPEIMDGRVKTLHPKVHGGILFDRANQDHVRQAQAHGIGRIDLVAVNLYRFEAQTAGGRLSAEEAIEHIDIGGPTMLRAAAKNWLHTTVLVDPNDYASVLNALSQGGVSKDLRRRLAAKAFATVSAYDRYIAGYFAEEATALLPDVWPLTLEKVQTLRYGENPHQPAALYRPISGRDGFANAEVVQGKELSYNNILDLDAASALAAEFEDTAAVIVKHTNPCGVAAGGGSLAEVFAAALTCDPKSAFGGIIACNRRVDRRAAEAMTAFFVECIAAPEFDAEALAVFAAKPNVRVLRAPWIAAPKAAGVRHLRSVEGAWLVQERDGGVFDTSRWSVVTQSQPTAAEWAELRLAMMVAKHVKSNAIVFVKDGATVGIGAGQMSRIDAANIAVSKASQEGRNVRGAVMASDAFFPFKDTVEFAAEHGVRAIVQPGGSKKDQDSIDAANAAGIAMVFTGERHFRH